MCDGANYLMCMNHALWSAGVWEDRRSANLVDGGAPFYDTYRCADGEWVAIGAIEPQFYSLLLDKLGLGKEPAHDQLDQSAWPARKSRFAEIFALKTRKEWCTVFEGVDACFAPVLNLEDSITDAHNVARGAFVTINGVVQPSPAPRFSATPGAIQGPPPAISDQSRATFTAWGLSPGEVDEVLGMEGETK
jgi:alpha-methylacyl-CoA racemase